MMSADDRVLTVEDADTGKRWRFLTWRGSAADRALATAQRLYPYRRWILREVR